MSAADHGESSAADQNRRHQSNRLRFATIYLIIDFFLFFQNQRIGVTVLILFALGEALEDWLVRRGFSKERTLAIGFALMALVITLAATAMSLGW